MKRRHRNILQAIIGALTGFFFLYLTLRNKSLELIFESISEAKWGYVILTGILLFVTFVLRALRWRILIQNLGYTPKRRTVLQAVIMGYFVNSFTPKLGEIVRCATLQKSTGVPLIRSFGSVISERIYDLLVLGLGLVAIFILEFDRLINLFERFLTNHSSSSANIFEENLLVFIISSLVIIGLVYYIISKGFHIKLKNILKEMYEAIKQTLYLKKYREFLTLTLLIWLSLIAMNYVCLQALPDTSQNGWYFATIVLFVGGIGWALPTPGGIGTTHYFIYQLFFIFNLDPDAGISYGVLSNGLTFIFTLGIGAVVGLFLLFRQKKTGKGNR